MAQYFGIHNHTTYSNLRLPDAIIHPKDLINKAIDLGLSGICITEHECLCNHVEINKIAIELQETNPDFTIGLGNEIYLTDTRDSGQKYYHFILLAKDAIGHRALRELSSTAWYYSYSDRGMERVPTLKAELTNVVKRFKGHLIATSACIGGELSTNALLYAQAMQANDLASAQIFGQNIAQFISFVTDLFGDDFYIECAPSDKKDQIMVNKQLYKIAQAYNIKMVVGTDAHYLRPENRYVHQSYLNSKDGEREVADFYEFAYLMTYNEVFNLLSLSFSAEQVTHILENTLEIQKKIKFYSLFHKQDIPNVEVISYPKMVRDEYKKYEHLFSMFQSNDVHDRYWVNQCIDKLHDLGKDNAIYLERLEEEAKVKSIIGEKLETNMFRYPNTLQHYIDLIWECGSMVGAGRGSSCAALNHYLLGVTQLDPIEWDLPFFRYLNEARVELGDIDIDICPSKRPLILQKIKEERATMLIDGLPGWAYDELGCTLVATFGTETTKSAIQTACRGYRSKDFPEGIDVDTAQYMSSLVPSERGFLWELNDVVYGNEEKGRKPSSLFVTEVNKYPGLLDIMLSIQGLISRRGSHASGVIFFDKDPFEHCAFMKTPSGDIVTQFDLHDAEWCGLTKYDFLVTEVQDKLVQTIQLLQQDKQIEPELTLRQVYNKYFHPNVLPIEDDAIWDALGNVSVINTFQFDSQVGAQVAKLLKPRSIIEMSDANGLMRLMGEDGEERPLDKYARFKKNISLWYKEMDDFGLTKEEQKTLEPYFKPSYGVPPSQEQLMKMLMDSEICGFSLADANAARKIVGKKKVSKIPGLKNQVLTQAKSSKLGQYVWKFGAGPQMGYSFSIIHSLAYSFIGAQTLYIATHWNPIYWDTACLIVNSGATDVSSSGSTDYGKIARAIGQIRAAGIKVSLANINKSNFGFIPDIENNQILFGLKGMLNVGDDVVAAIIENRPYSSPRDFLNKVNPNKQAMISLIKGGAFDDMEDRKFVMAWYIWETCDKKTRLTLQNMPTLIKRNLLAEDTDERVMARRVYEFNRYLKAITKADHDSCKGTYSLDDRAISFLQEIHQDELIFNYSISVKDWDKVYQKYMDIFRFWMIENKDEILRKLNYNIFMDDWTKYAGNGNISAWEMEVLCFYYHEHELAHVNQFMYGFNDFNKLSPFPIVDYTFQKGGRDINIFKLYHICGTCIAKNKVKSTVTLLTTSGVVNVKIRKEMFAMYDKQISERQSDGTKKVMEKSWFNRGNMIVVTGIRSGDDFIAKKYASTGGHTLYRIAGINSDGSLILQDQRYQGVTEDEE